MHPEWERLVRELCLGNGVAYFFKQWGEWAPVEGNTHCLGDLIHYTEIDRNPRAMRRVGKKAAGHLIDGVEYQELPAGVKP